MASIAAANVRHITICHVISGDLWGGAEAQAAALISRLTNQVGVCVIVFNRGELSARIEQAGIPVDVADESHLGFARMVIRVLGILGQRRPDVVHAHGFKENLIVGIAARMRGIPVVRTHHGRGMIGVGKRHTLVERVNAALLTDRLIAVSDDLAKFLRWSHISIKNLRVIRNGIKLSSGALAVRHEPTEERGFVIGTVGRLVAVKNHRCLLDAFKRVRDRIAGARLLIVGDGPLADSLRAQAEALGIADRVEFTGFQRNVDAFLRRMDVFVLCSRHEGIPISLLEAMSIEIPVVCTRVGGIPEVIDDNRSGLLVESDHAESLGAAIIRIASDADLAQHLAANARATVSNELSFDRCLASTLSLYREVVTK